MGTPTKMHIPTDTAVAVRVNMEISHSPAAAKKNRNAEVVIANLKLVDFQTIRPKAAITYHHGSPLKKESSGSSRYKNMVERINLVTLIKVGFTVSQLMAKSIGSRIENSSSDGKLFIHFIGDAIK